MNKRTVWKNEGPVQAHLNIRRRWPLVQLAGNGPGYHGTSYLPSVSEPLDCAYMQYAATDGLIDLQKPVTYHFSLSNQRARKGERRRDFNMEKGSGQVDKWPRTSPSSQLKLNLHFPVVLWKYNKQHMWLVNGENSRRMSYEKLIHI